MSAGPTEEEAEVAIPEMVKDAPAPVDSTQVDYDALGCTCFASVLGAHIARPTPALGPLSLLPHTHTHKHRIC